MAYVDVEDEALSNKEGDEEKRQAAIDAAATRIDSCLSGRYVVPVDTTGKDGLKAWLEWINRAIAGYFLSQGTAGTGQKWAKDYAEAMRALNDIKNGKARLPGAVEAVNASAGTIVAVGPSGDKVSSSFRRDLFDAEGILFS